jgi:hypothetical protein
MPQGLGMGSKVCIMGPNVTPRYLLAVLFPTVALAGCGSETDDRPAIWSYIAPAIIAPNCATSSCHSEGAAVAGLDLSTAENAYATLMQQKLPQVEGARMDRDTLPRQLIIKGNPAQSRVVNMLRAYGANRMPPDRPLAEADIQLIEQWILLGANND